LDYVRIFDLVSSTWTQVGTSMMGNEMTVAFSSDGSVLAVGELMDNGFTKVSVHKLTGTTWHQLGSTINSRSSQDKAGKCIALSADGSIIAVGATGAHDDPNWLEVRVYQHVGEEWTQLGVDINGGLLSDERSNVVLSADGYTLALGGIGEGGQGMVRVFCFDLQMLMWSEAGENILGSTASKKFGRKVALSADASVLVVSAFEDNGRKRGHVGLYGANSSSLVPTPAPSSAQAVPSQIPSKLTSNPTESHPSTLPSTCPFLFKMILWSDYQGQETSYSLLDKDGHILFENESLVDDEVYKESACLLLDYKYIFQISDTNGICCANGSGFFSLSLNGRQIQYGGEFNVRRNIVFTPRVGDGVVIDESPTQLPSESLSDSPSKSPAKLPSSPPSELPSSSPTKLPSSPPADPLEFYEFTPHLDSNGKDIKGYPRKSIYKLAEMCNETPECKGFNSNGWLKHTIRNRSQWKWWTNDPTLGFYLKIVASEKEEQ